MSSEPSISFVIPVRNDADRLRRCLRSIKACRYPGDRVEILVADNGSTDGSDTVAREEGATVLTLPHVRLGELRNRAAAATRGPMLAFVDADHEIGPDWVAAATSILERDDVAGVGAPYHAPIPGTWVQQFYDRLRRRPREQEEVDWLGSGNLALRRARFDDVGGFDTSLETCEDVDLCRKLRATGRTLIADSRLHSVHHGDPRTLGSVFFGELWRGRDNIRVSLRAPRSWRTVASAVIPVINLFAVTAAALGLLFAAWLGWTVPALAAAAVVALIGLRALQMVRASSTDLPRAFAVASAYELGRAFAVAARFGYGHRRAGAVT